MQLNVHCKKKHGPARRIGILLLTGFFLSPIILYSQEMVFSFKKASLEEVFQAIEQKTEYRFVYAREEIKGAPAVTLTINSSSIDTIVSRLLYGSPLGYAIHKNYISIHRKEEGKPLPQADKIDIEGKILNEHGEGIAGASVIVKETAIATSTDENGRFGLRGIDVNGILQVSSVGYKSKEIPINGRTNIEVRLAVSVSLLDETVVIAYGTTTKRLNTGSVSKVTAREIGQQPVSNPIAALEGRVPGLFVTQGTGLPGSNFTVLLRGRNSIQNGNSPLYIIDGVPFLSDADRLTQFNTLNTNSPFNSINPNDIASIEVLKDADATAIYGSRGANGVILITTKKGKAGKTKVDLMLYRGWGKVTQTTSMLKTDAYVKMRREAFANDSITPVLSNAYDILAWDTTRFTDWKKLLIGNTAGSYHAEARLSGGNAATNFSLGANYYKETTVFPSKDLNDIRKSFNLSLNHSSDNKKFKAILSANFASDDGNLLLNDLTRYARLPPNAPPIYNADGHLNFTEGGFSFSNPYALLLQTYKGYTDRLTSSLNLNYKLFTSFELRISLGYTSVGIDETSLYPIASQNPSFSPSGSSLFGKNNFKSWIIEPQAEYDQKFGKLNLQALAGSSLQKNVSAGSMISAFGFTNDAFLKNTGSLPATNVSVSNTYVQYRYTGLFGRLGFNLSDKYLLHLTGRRDGSTRFGPGRQWANFGAAGAGWIFTKENWFTQHLLFLSFGKLKGSYGITGNDKIGDYQYLDTWASNPAYQNQTALRPSKLFNDDYSWEAIRKAEASIELGFLKDKLLLTVNWFKSRSDNQLIRYNLPSQTGFTSIFRNFPGKVENKGFEFEVSGNNISMGKLRWNPHFNLTIARNKLADFPGLESSTYASSYMIGYPLNITQGYNYLGVDAQSGVYQFEDINKDGKITPRTVSNMMDYIIIGTTDPDFYGGLENQFEFKNWELSFHFQFVKQLGRDPIFSNSTPPGFMSNISTALDDRWRVQGDGGLYQKLTQTTGPVYTAQQLVARSSAALTDASYTRLKNVYLSYEIPAVKIKRLKMESCKLFAQGQNVLTITKYKGLDPENQSLNFLTPLRFFTVGFKIIF